MVINIPESPTTITRTLSIAAIGSNFAKLEFDIRKVEHLASVQQQRTEFATLQAYTLCE